MGKTPSKETFIHIAIYWGGAELGTVSCSLSRRHTITAGKSRRCDIRSVIWPLLDELELLISTSAGMILNPDIPWDGVIATTGDAHVLSSLKPTSRVFEIKPGTTASLKFHQLSIAIRVGPKKQFDLHHINKVHGYQGSFFSFIADQSSEWVSLGVGICSAAILAISVGMALENKPADTYMNLAELPGKNLLPFISPHYLATAPDVLQFRIDRFDFVHSVWQYYDGVTSVLAYGSSGTDREREKDIPFNSTMEQYELLFREQQETLAKAQERQMAVKYQHPVHQSLLSLPVVKGESIESKILRVLDKVATVSTTSSELAQKRRDASVEFENDMGFKYEGAKINTATTDAYKKISDSFLGQDSDETMQLTQAKTAAAQAAQMQLALFGESRLKFGAIDCCQHQVAAPLTEDDLTYLTPAERTIDLQALKASVWGEPTHEPHKIIEPKHGHLDPVLVENTVNAGRYQLRLCYELALRRNNQARGTMEWTWKIDTRGLISDVGLIKSSLKDEDLERCVRDKIARWKFPKPHGGSVEIRYPFEFSRDKG